MQSLTLRWLVRRKYVDVPKTSNKDKLGDSSGQSTLPKIGPRAPQSLLREKSTHTFLGGTPLKHGQFSETGKACLDGLTNRDRDRDADRALDSGEVFLSRDQVHFRCGVLP